MASRRFRRKYQTGGGVLPSLQGAQVLGQPQRINQQIRPIEYNPSGAFQALRQRDSNLRTAISQGDFQRRERQDAWTREIQGRRELTIKAEQLRLSSQAALDQLTKLDMNIPEQMAMAQKMRSQFDEINDASATILNDNSLTPQERATRLQEQTLKAQGLFSDPNYVKYVQNNVLADKVYSGITEAASNGKTLIDMQSANANLELANKFKRGQIGREAFFQGYTNYTLDPKVTDEFETKVDQWIVDTLDPDKAATNWEQHRNEDGYLIFQEKFKVPSLADQVDAVFDLYKNNDAWMKVQEARGNRAFLNEDGLLDDEKLRGHIRRKINLLRGSLGAQGKEMTVDIETRGRGNSTSGGGTGSGGGGGAGTLTERQNAQKERALQNFGYSVVDPSLLDEMRSATEEIQILERPESYYKDDDGEFKNENLEAEYRWRETLQRGLVPTSELPPDRQQTTGATTTGTGRAQQGDLGMGGANMESLGLQFSPVDFEPTQAPETRPVSSEERLGQVSFDDRGFLINSDLQVGRNPHVAPVRMNRNLGLHTNNPLNIKGRPERYPVIDGYDKEGPNDAILHRAFPTMRAGTIAAMNLLNRYKSGENSTFTSNLKKADKTIEDATVGDLYRTWATGATDAHIEKIARVAGVEPDTNLKDVSTEQLFKGLVSVENPQIYDAMFSDNPNTNLVNPGVTNTVTGGNFEMPTELEVMAGKVQGFPNSNVDVSRFTIEALRRQKDQIQEENVFDDDITDEIEQIDREILERQKILTYYNEATDKLSEVEPGERVKIPITEDKSPSSRGYQGFGGDGSAARGSGARVYVDPSERANIDLTVTKSKRGDYYRVQMGNKILQPKLTETELDNFLRVAAGRSPREIASLEPEDFTPNVAEPLSEEINATLNAGPVETETTGANTTKPATTQGLPDEYKFLNN